MILYPNCKINIGLAVTHKREDGYHDLDTVFYPVPGLCDTLEIEHADTFSFTQEGITVDCPAEDNLIVRCYRMMQSTFPDRVGPVAICFGKHIPFGAGLGGGSADATFTAIGLNELFDLGLTRADIARLVKPLGADCPFFAYNTPCHATGIGDLLTPIDQETDAWQAENLPFLTSLHGKRLILVKPDTHVSTREAYGGIIPRDRQEHPTTDMRINDFELTVFAHHPELAAIKQSLLDAGALYAAMSGSGSTIFAFFCPEQEVSLPDGITKDIIYNRILS